MTEAKEKLNRKQRRAKRRERIALGLPAPIPRVLTHGQIPDPAEGWVPDKFTENAELRIGRIIVVRFNDGNTQRFYKMIVRTEILKRKRELAKKTLKKVRRENREAEKKEEKQRKRELRAVFAIFGRS